MVNQNLFNVRDEQWKRIRTIASCALTSGKIKKLYGLVRQCLQNYLELLEELVGQEEGLQVKKLHENFTMDVIASCAFATQTNAAKDPNNEFTRMTRKILDYKLIKLFPAFLFPRALNKLLDIKTIFDPEANEWLVNLSKHIVERRRKSGEKNNDFLQLLMDASTDDKNKDDKHNELHFIDQGDHIVIFILLTIYTYLHLQ